MRGILIGPGTAGFLELRGTLFLAYTQINMNFPLMRTLQQKIFKRVKTSREQKSGNLSISAFGTPSGARTLDPNIKSVVLYQLS